LKELINERKSDIKETQNHYIVKNDMLLQRYLFLSGMFEQPNRQKEAIKLYKSF